jgi:hypothetical protein
MVTAGLFDRGDRDRALHAKASSESVDGLMKSLREELGAGQEPLVREKLKNMPKTFRLNYIKAMKGNSFTSSVKAFCSECCGYDRDATRACVCMACPLYPHRPYQK